MLHSRHILRKPKLTIANLRRIHWLFTFFFMFAHCLFVVTPANQTRTCSVYPLHWPHPSVFHRPSPPPFLSPLFPTPLCSHPRLVLTARLPFFWPLRLTDCRTRAWGGELINHLLAYHGLVNTFCCCHYYLHQNVQADEIGCQNRPHHWRTASSGEARWAIHPTPHHHWQFERRCWGDRLCRRHRASPGSDEKKQMLRPNGCPKFFRRTLTLLLTAWHHRRKSRRKKRRRRRKKKLKARAAAAAAERTRQRQRGWNLIRITYPLLRNRAATCPAEPQQMKKKQKKRRKKAKRNRLRPDCVFAKTSIINQFFNVTFENTSIYKTDNLCCLFYFKPVKSYPGIKIKWKNKNVMSVVCI